jgi:hypothetical protein
MSEQTFVKVEDEVEEFGDGLEDEALDRTEARMCFKPCRYDVRS